MTSEGYILNQLQNPGGLKVVYDSIDDGNKTNEEIQKDTSLPESSVEELLGALNLLGMVRRKEYEYEAVRISYESIDADLSFRIAILNNLAEAAEPGNWGKQSVVLLNYEYLISEDIQELENNEQALYENIDNWIEKTTDYRPKGGELYSHNSPKFGNWVRLASFLNLLYKADGRTHTVFPDPELIYESIRIASWSRDSFRQSEEADIGIDEYMVWLHNNLIRIDHTEGDSVPAVLARILFTLVRDERIELIEYGDAGSAELTRLPTQSHRGIDKEANSIKITPTS
jgi:DNA-binding HxlR family transcriptional regulator